MRSLEGKVAIITGGGGVIGLGMAKALVKEGVSVVVTGRTQGTLDKARDELLKTPGAQVLALRADGTEEEDVKAAVRRTVEAFGRIDILINNAQTVRRGIPLEGYTKADFEVVYGSGVFATFLYMKHCFPFLKETKGTIINFGSGAGLNGQKGFAAYGSNKEAIRGLTRTAAKEWGQYGITVNVINPLIKTARLMEWTKIDPEGYRWHLENTPLGAFGDAERDCGGLCVFLAKPESKYMTGMTFNVDGGLSLRP